MKNRKLLHQCSLLYEKHTIVHALHSGRKIKQCRITPYNLHHNVHIHIFCVELNYPGRLLKIKRTVSMHKLQTSLDRQND